MASSSSRAHDSSMDSPASKRRKMDNPCSGILPCLVCKEPFRRRGDLWEHLTTKEKGINVFVCMSCSRGFCKERLLRSHLCEAGEMANKQQTGLSVLCHVMACEECGLFAGLINIENPSWKSYSSLCAHPSRSFRKITLYTWTPDAIRFIKSDLSIPFTVRIEFGPAVTSGVPIQCELCSKRYSSVEDVEKHVSQTHPVAFAPVQCQHCSCKFSSPLRMDLHISEKHGRGRWDLMDFLKTVAVAEPFMEQAAAAGRTDSFYFCDLCEQNFLGSQFNKHDCAINYMRRYLLDGKVIFCPATNLTECKIDMSNQDPMLISLTDKVQRNLELSLRFYIPLVAPKVDDFKADRVFSCNHCECVVISPTLFREHVLEAFQSQRIDFEWPKVIANGRDLLSYFGVPVTISEAGFICPKAGCSTTWCSTVGLELHIRNAHQDTFEPLKIPDFVVPAGIVNDANTPPSCPICREQGFQDRKELQAHVRDCHVHPCNSCASCFSSIVRLDHHKRSSSCGEEPECDPPLSYCPICKEIFRLLPDYYSHLVAHHPTDARHDEIIGHILPKCLLFLRPARKNECCAKQTNGIPTVGAAISRRSEATAANLGSNLNDSVVVLSEAPTRSMDHGVQMLAAAPEQRPDGATQSAGDGNVEDDDEVAVCEPEPGSSTGRQPTHPCGHCSRTFYTQRAAEEHRKTHEFDAGLITEEILPVPNNTNVYVCRLCCLAYEMYDAYNDHMQKHRRIVDCSICSAVCLNPQYLASHLESHRANSLAFGCPHCWKAFRSEVALMLHMSQDHAFPILWHCHRCGLANSEWRHMSMHTCMESQPDLPIITPTSKKKLHFQPRRNGTTNGGSNSHSSEVADCCHRSFLAYKEAGIACEKCGTIIPSTSFVATAGDKAPVRLVMAEETTERVMILSHPCSKYMKSALSSGFKPATIMTPRTIAPRPVGMPNLNHFGQPQPPVVVMRNQSNNIQRPFFKQM